MLSSGFLAFASHSGFLKAVEAASLQVSGVMGTSAGALSGSLYCAGYSPDAVRTASNCMPRPLVSSCLIACTSAQTAPPVRCSGVQRCAGSASLRSLLPRLHTTLP